MAERSEALTNQDACDSELVPAPAAVFPSPEAVAFIRHWQELQAAYVAKLGLLLVQTTELGN